MKLTTSQVRKIMPKAPYERASAMALYFTQWSDRFGLTTAARAAAFLAQVAHESAELTVLTENLNYSAEGLLRVFPKYFTVGTAQLYARNPEKIANRVYAGRMGNGSEGSGDGYRFRGRGCLQLTGRANYQAYARSEYCNGDLMGHPEWLAQFPGAAKSAMWFWRKNGLNRWADRGDFRGLTKAINGGLNGLDDRLKYWERAKEVFGV